jgi:hypothetical protein
MMATLFFYDDPDRDAIFAAEVTTTLRHWQRLMLQDVVDDIESYLDHSGTQRLRQETAEILTFLLAYPLHGDDRYLRLHTGESVE